VKSSKGKSSSKQSSQWFSSWFTTNSGASSGRRASASDAKNESLPSKHDGEYGPRSKNFEASYLDVGSASPTLLMLRQARARTKQFHKSKSMLLSVSNADTSVLLPGGAVANSRTKKIRGNTDKRGSVTGGQTSNLSVANTPPDTFQELVSDMVQSLHEAGTLKACIVSFFEGIEKGDFSQARETVSEELSRNCNDTNMFWSELASVLLYLLAAEKQFVSLQCLQDKVLFDSMVDMFERSMSGVLRLLNAQIVTCSDQSTGYGGTARGQTDTTNVIPVPNDRSGNLTGNREINSATKNMPDAGSSSTSGKSSLPSQNICSREEISGSATSAGWYSLFSPNVEGRQVFEYDEEIEDAEEDRIMSNATVNSMDREILSSQSALSALDEFASVFTKMSQFLKLRLMTVEVYSRLSSPASTLQDMKIPEAVRINVKDLQGVNGPGFLQNMLEQATNECYTVTLLAHARFVIASYDLRESMLALQHAQAQIIQLSKLVRANEDLVQETVGIGPFPAVIRSSSKTSVTSERSSQKQSPQKTRPSAGESSRSCVRYAQRMFNLLTMKTTLYFSPILEQRLGVKGVDDSTQRQKLYLVNRIRQFMSQQAKKLARRSGPPQDTSLGSLGMLFILDAVQCAKYGSQQTNVEGLCVPTPSLLSRCSIGALDAPPNMKPRSRSLQRSFDSQVEIDSTIPAIGRLERCESEFSPASSYDDREDGNHTSSAKQVDKKNSQVKLTRGPSGYFSPEFPTFEEAPHGREGMRLLRLPFESTKDLRSCLGLLQSTDGYLSTQRDSKGLKLAQNKPATKTTIDGMFKPIEGVASWPVMCS